MIIVLKVSAIKSGHGSRLERLSSIHLIFMWICNEAVQLFKTLWCNVLNLVAANMQIRAMHCAVSMSRAKSAS